MSVLQQATAGAEGGEERRWKDWKLDRETELRLEVPDDVTIDVKVHTIH